MISNKKVLVTGGAGFIGTHVAERLADSNIITILDIDLQNVLIYSKLYPNGDVSKIKADVRDLVTVRDIVIEHDVVLHFASLLGVKNVIENARDTIDTIILGTRNVLEGLRIKPNIHRLIYISTSEVYGDIMNATEEAHASIGTNNDPRLCYASAKLMGEHQIWAYHRDFAIPTVIVRPFNIFGPRRKGSHAIGHFVVKALMNKDIVVHGDGSQLRSWCYIDDFVDGIVACLERDEAIGQDYNLGNPVTATTIYDLADRIIRLTGSTSKITQTKHTFTDIGVRAPSATKAHMHLGYRPKYDLDAGLIKTIEWYRAHLDDFRHWA